MSGQVPNVETVTAKEIRVGDNIVFTDWTCPVRKIVRHDVGIQLFLARMRPGITDENYWNPTFGFDAELRREVRR